jgi:hypothetical protein
MAENFILEEVIADLVDTNKSLVSPLMKLQYFAKRTKNEDLLQFVLAELNGYKGHGNLPDYRITSALIHIDIQFGENKHPNLELPVEMLDEKNKDAFRKFYLTDSVSVLEHMLNNKDSKDNGQYLIFNFPLTLMSIFQNAGAKLYKNPYFRTEVVGGRLLGNSNILPTALTAIRSRLLSFCMEIGDTFGYNIAIDSFNKSQSINNEKVIHLMSTVINNHGDGNIVNSGDNANIQASINISKGNKEQLNQKLKQLGVDTSDIEELNEIVEEEVPNHENKKLGNKTVDWITKVSGKALKGVGSIAKEVTSSLLANLLMQYLGIPPIS